MYNDIKEKENGFLILIGETMMRKKKTRQQLLLDYLKEGGPGGRRWRDCRNFYMGIAIRKPYEAGQVMWSMGYNQGTIDEAWALRLNRLAFRRATGCALERLELQGFAKRLKRGVWAAV